MLRDLANGAGRILISLYARLALDFDVAREARYPAGAKVVALNHPTTSDPFVTIAAIPEPMSILITESCFKLPVLGALLRAAGHIEVVAGNGRAAFDEAVRRIENGETVGIFPEGALSPAGGLGPPRTGAARLALTTGAPIVPVGIALERDRAAVVPTEIDGVREVVRWYLHGPYAVTVGARVTEVADDVMRQIADLARESDRRVHLMAAASARRTFRATLPESA